MFNILKMTCGPLEEAYVEEFENKYPQGSREFQLFERFTKLELAGLLIEYGFLSEICTMIGMVDFKQNGSELNQLSME